MGDIITLFIQADFQTTKSKLDLTKLKDQFDVINQQQSNQIEIVNGGYASFTRWQIQILPKQVGTLMIPPFEINGVKSKALPIKVTKAVYSDSDKPYFLEATVDKDKVFVQEQVIYTLRFFHKGSLINGNIRPPNFENALVEPLKEQSVYGKTINGKQYTVHEWKYAVFPQTSGELKIVGPAFTGLLNLRSRQKGVQAIAKPTVINVMSAPNTQQTYWLPASNLKITQTWHNLPTEIKLGDSLRRIITLEVEGLKSSQLPTISTPNTNTYKVYADQDKDKQTASDHGIKSVKTISQAIVPTKAGTLEIPDETITWWNTRTQKFEKAVLKTPPLQILGKNSVANPSKPLPLQDTLNSKPALPSQLEQAKSYDDYYPVTDKDMGKTYGIANFIWPIIALVVGILWLITLLILLQTRKKLKFLTSEQNLGKKNKTTDAVTHTFNHQWCEMPLQDFYTELLRQLHEDLGIKSIDSIPIERLKMAIFQLESHLFAGEQLGYDTQQTICDNWAALITMQNTKEKEKEQLTNLYQN